MGEVLCRQAVWTEEQKVTFLARFLEIPQWSMESLAEVDMAVAQSIPERVARRNRLIPIRKEPDNTILLVMADPLDVLARDTVANLLKTRVKLAISTVSDIEHSFERIYRGSHVQEQRIRDLIGVEADQGGTDNVNETTIAENNNVIEAAEANNAPVVRFVDLLMSQAVQSRASDIHIEPQDNTMSIRMRVDGVLREMIPPPRKMQASVIARIKILAAMNIAERRLPQDGRLKIKSSGRQIDVRVSVIPTIYGEKVVMRILDKDAVNHDLDCLGFEPKLLKIFKRTISQPHGIVVVTGPTGSGKSTTLYSALNYLRDSRKNITTVEDPVEYRLHGINQIQTKPQIGLTFANCLRSILRQDPDIVLIGEVRDRETMEIAIQGSLTGHLVLTTFHTNDAPSTLSRLIYMGLERYLVASTINLITAQRLVRRICEKCKSPTDLDEETLAGLRMPPEKIRNATFCIGRGCAACGGTGYNGRIPIFEFMPMDEQIRRLVSQSAEETDIRAAVRARGFGSLLHSALDRMCAGLTTLEEVMRVTYVEHMNED